MTTTVNITCLDDLAARATDMWARVHRSDDAQERNRLAGAATCIRLYLAVRRCQDREDHLAPEGTRPLVVNQLIMAREFESVAYGRDTCWSLVGYRVPIIAEDIVINDDTPFFTKLIDDLEMNYQAYVDFGQFVIDGMGDNDTLYLDAECIRQAVTDYLD